MQNRPRLKTALALGFGVLMACPSSAVLAATPVEVLVKGTVHQALFAVDFEGSNGIAVGAAGEVQTTEDGGKTWKGGKVATDLALLGVHTDAVRTLAVGQAGTGFVKNAGGAWEKITTGTEKRLFGVSSNVGGLSAAVGEFGALLLSEDGGRTWHSLTLDWMQVGTEGGAEPHLYAVDVSPEGLITAVGEFGLVLRSADRGRSWSVQNRGTASLFAIEFRDDGVGYAVGQDGYALKSTDHGLSWVCIDVGSKAILNGVHAAADGHVTISAMREMMVSSDDGATWSSVDNPEVTSMWYVGVGSAGAGVLAVGQAGRIIRVGG